jgi:peptidyl-prolyl cis-trans isomerase-like 4
MSLHYAFIEYEDAQCCEAAYFKMDNVLIDDRRIHVDFSQSVAKNYTWNKKANTNKGTRGRFSSSRIVLQMRHVLQKHHCRRQGNKLEMLVANKNAPTTDLRDLRFERRFHSLRNPKT